MPEDEHQMFLRSRARSIPTPSLASRGSVMLFSSSHCCHSLWDLYEQIGCMRWHSQVLLLPTGALCAVYVRGPD